MSFRELEPYCQLELTHTKTTKGTYVFGTDAEDAPITSLYISKSTFRNGIQGSPPPSILVTISVPDPEA